MKINIKTVAQKAGVSTATVSRVISGYTGVREETKKKVLKEITELNYEVNSVARSFYVYLHLINLYSLLMFTLINVLQYYYVNVYNLL